MSSRNFSYQLFDGTFLLVHSKVNPTDAEWDGYIEALRRKSAQVESMRTVVMTDGGGPNQSQRDRLNGVLAGRATRTAILSDSARVRFVVSSLVLFNPSIRCFVPGELAQALAHLEMPGARWAGLRATLEWLQSDIAPTQVETLARVLASTAGPPATRG